MTENRRQQAVVRNSEKGFTLIELAIVLVIIGIILGAVLKGQDLIENARLKKAVVALHQFEVLSWTYYDRNGSFPTTKTNLDTLSNSPTSNSVTLGSTTLYFGVGTDSNSKNVIVMCASSDCSTTVFSDANAVLYANAVDLAIDGSTDGTAGRVQGFLGSPTINSSSWNATAITVTSSSTVAWATAKALLYYFDKR